ncbi:MAG: ABC-type transport auxiliary lipoprotein family protein [Candidatus Scalindua sp.]
MVRYIIIILILFSLAFSGCISLKQPNTKFEYYTLEYDALSPDKPTASNHKSTILKIKHFSTAPIYNTDRIIYSDQQFKRTPYFYHKWKVKPGEFVTYFLSRDLKESGLFEAVLPPASGSPHTHTVEGVVDEFLEWDSNDSWEAVLSISVTLQVDREPDADKRVIFQRSFSTRKKCKEKNPLALAQAMSLAMAEVSKEIGIAIHKALAGK